ncbi:MAG: hypothetical protein WCP06_07165 [Verrucomicrobiota bacterium]
MKVSLGIAGSKSMIAWIKGRANLWTMKLRLDLLKRLTADDILEEAVATNHRFKPEPLLSKTGVGSLLSASTKERANEAERSMALARKLHSRVARSGKSPA